jgi:polysaccharide deacetylase family protein (PEP-CTERM system associated)
MKAAKGKPEVKPIKHMLSFDVEEYFQVEAACGHIGRSSWAEIQKRLPASIDLVLQTLEDQGQRATFFVLGWVAQHEPGIVKLIASCGHELASHGMSHAMIHRQSRDEFRHDVMTSKKLLEDLCGERVLGYRAPTFSVTQKTAWALDVLAESGYRYDSSIFPVRHDRYGVPNAPQAPHWAIAPNGGRILELPPLTLRLARTNLPVGGGGYLRLLPCGLVSLALEKMAQQRSAAMIYLHPWELDAQQPPLPVGKCSLWRHRVNLHRTADKLRTLMCRFNFTDTRSLLPTFDNLGFFKYGSRS